jgi:hypothetical protein
MGPPPVVVPGERYGHLLVVALESKRKRRYRQYACRCACGRGTVVTSSDLRHGRVTSCGCARIEGARQAGRASAAAARRSV